MSRFSIDIFHQGEQTPFCATHKLTQNESFMGQSYVTTTIETDTPIAFKIGDFLVYRGRKFVLAVTPSLQKQARVSSTGNAIKYDNVKFVSVISDELTRCEFRDIVNSQTDHYNFAARTFSFHCQTLKDYAERLKANLDRMYEGYVVKVLLDNGNEYVVGSAAAYIDNAVGEKNKVVQISNETCWDSLQHVKNDFKVNLYFDGDRTIVLGANGHLISQHHFAYGAGEGLFKISRTTDESQAIITRLRAYGSEKNMPTRFYANLKYLYLLPKELITEASCNGTKIDLENGTIDFANDGFLTIGFDGSMLANSTLSSSVEFTSPSNGYKKHLLKVNINGVIGWMNIQNNGKDSTSYANVGWTNDNAMKAEYGNNTEVSAKALIAEFARMQWTYFVIEEGYTETWKYKVTDPTCVIPNNMNVKCLMLAGFGFNENSLRDEIKAVYDNPSTAANATLISRLGYSTYNELIKHFSFSDDPSDPYIDAVEQKEEYGVREGTIQFDGSSEDYDEIYPSIEYIGGSVDTAPVQSAKVDGSSEFVGNGLRNDGGVIDDLTEAGKDVPQFYLYIKDPNFDPYEYRKSGSTSFKINMIDGMCGGRSFDVKQSRKCTFADGTTGYRLVCDRVEDSSLDLYFPYSQIRGGVEVGYVIKAGDQYTFSDIKMPNEYVLRTALYELVPAAIEALKKNCDVRFKYELSVDPNEMYRQHVLSLTDDNVESVHDTIHAGDLILFGDSDLGLNYDASNETEPITGSVIINSIEIKENDSVLPKYTIQLVDEMTIGTIEKIQRQIDALTNGTSSTASSGYSASDIQGLIRTYGANYFLSKQRSDTAKGDLTFEGTTTLNGDVNINKEVNFGNSLFKGTSGAGVWKDAQGNWHIQTDYLDINYAISAKSIEIQEEKHIGGCQIITGAGCTIDHVDDTPKVVTYKGNSYTAYRCYFLAVDPDTEKEITNDWMIGDQARCQSFNLKTGIHFYWRLVLNVSTDVEEIDGRKYHYIDLFAGSASGSISNDVLQTLRIDSSNAPLDGDDVILLGSQSGVIGRQNAIIIAGAGSGSPYIREYAGIKTFTLNGYCEINIEPTNSFLKVKSLKITSSDGTETDVEDKLKDIAGDIQDLIGADGTLDGKIAELLAMLQLSQQEIDDLKDSQEDINTQLDQTYEFWHVDWAASFDADGNLVIPSITSVEPCSNWGTSEDPYSEHVGDFIITTDGICFQFEDTETNGVYVLVARSDKYLLAAMAISTDNKVVLDEMANDGVITPQEKTLLSNIWTSEYASGSKILTDNEEEHSTATQYTTLSTKLLALKGVMDVVLAKAKWDENISLSSVVPTGKTFEGIWNEYYEAYEEFDKYVKDAINSTAESAQSDASDALDKLEDIASDGIITTQEHSQLGFAWDSAKSQYNQAIADAGKYSSVNAVSTANTALTTSFNTLKTLVESVLNMTTDYTIVEAYTNAWSDFFSKLETLTGAITDAAKAAADAAQQAADDAQSAAEDAQAAASAAQDILDEIASDGKITIQEHFDLSDTWDNMTSQYNQAIANADNYISVTAVATAKANLVSAYNTLKSLVDAVLASTESYTITEAYTSAWSNFFTKLEALTSAVTTAAKANADDAQKDASSALDSLSKLANDNVITIIEMGQLIPFRTEVDNNQDTLTDTANTLIAKLNEISKSSSMLSSCANAFDGTCTALIAILDEILEDTTKDFGLLDANGKPLRAKDNGVTSYSNSTSAGRTYSECLNDYYEQLPAINAEIANAQYVIDQYNNELANTANDTANEAAQTISDMASDNVITKQEKVTLGILWEETKKEYVSARSEYNSLPETSGSLDESFEESYSILFDIMNKILVTDAGIDTRLKDDEGNLLVYGEDDGGVQYGFADAWSRYKYYLGEINQDITSKTQNSISDAQDAADEANASLSAMANDNVITKQEKISLKERLSEISAEYNNIVSEAATANVSSLSYQSSYNALYAFLTYLTTDMSTDTELVRSSDGKILWANYQYGLAGSATSFTISYVTQSKYSMPAGMDYTSAVSSYYNALSVLRKNITDGVYTAIQNANESGYDEEINNYVNWLRTNLTTEISNGVSGNQYVVNFTSLYNSLSNWTWSKDEDTGGLLINGAGVVTSSNFASMFASAYDDNGTLISNALLSVFVSKDSDGYLQSGVKIKGDQISLEGVTTINGKFKVNANGTIEGTDAKFNNVTMNNVTMAGLSATGANITGEIHATKGTFEGSIVTKFVKSHNLSTYDYIVHDMNGTEYMLPTSSSNIGRKVIIYNSNYTITRVAADWESTIYTEDGSQILGTTPISGNDNYSYRYPTGFSVIGCFLEFLAVPSTLNSSKCQWILLTRNIGTMYKYRKSDGTWVYDDSYIP